MESFFTCSEVLHWELFDFVPCIRILMDQKCEKVPLALRVSIFKLLISITTGLCSPTKFLIHSFENPNVYETNINYIPSVGMLIAQNFQKVLFILTYLYFQSHSSP